MDTKQPEALRLAPCPFCGGGARRTTVGTNAWFGTGCDGDQSCPAHLRALTHKTQAEADAAWNRRTPPAASELLRLRAENDAARLEIESLKARVQELGQQARECSDRKVVQLEAALDRHIRSGKDWAMRAEALERTITTLRAQLASRNAQAVAAEKVMRELENANSIALQLDARIKELEAQLDAVGAGGVEPLRKRECLHQITEPDHFRGATKMVPPDHQALTDTQMHKEFAALRERIFDARIGRACSRCEGGTYQADNNGYSQFHRCNKCHYVPMWGEDGSEFGATAAPKGGAHGR